MWRFKFYLDLKYHWRRVREAVEMKIAWLLPPRIAYWCVIRVWGHATTGKYSGTCVPELTVDEALKRYKKGE